MMLLCIFMLRLYSINTQTEDITMEILFEKETLEAIYLDWANNFISTWRFAERYGISEKDASDLIEICRRAHNNLLTGI